MKLREKIEEEKRLLADYLNGMSEKVSLKTKKRLLIIIGIGMGCICLSMMLAPFQNPVNNFDLIPKETTLPTVIVPPDNNEDLFSHEDYTMLVNFKQTMDSLKRYDRSSYEEILNGRSGLMDSINFLISLYQKY